MLACLLACRAANKKEEAKLQETLEDAKLNHGEAEVLDAIVARGDFYARIGLKVRKLMS